MATDTVTGSAGSLLPLAPVLGALSLPAEPGYDPAAILASRLAEGATVVSLGTFLAARFVWPARSRRYSD
jgi:hypothetical protein